MSMKKLAILSSQNEGKLNGTDMHPTPGSPPAPVQGVNVMLGGAMLSGIILVVFIMCYCCHKTNRKSQSHLPTYWRDPGLSLEIYTVESGQNWLVAEDFALTEMHRPPTPGPPPAYDVVVPITKEDLDLEKTDESGLPTYESAVQLSNGYV
ncbi:unnamed protein product [Brassicogethes aeneus]|uniref:Uncharacterized protein n=1 Tax=Brassicogethes aeneus TaxID=1431903 RepID=A0A9P0AXR6_BRAAE|nr:unnamed protein product [Brassicogethes aeneus]